MALIQNDVSPGGGQQLVAQQPNLLVGRDYKALGVAQHLVQERSTGRPPAAAGPGPDRVVQKEDTELGRPGPKLAQPLLEHRGRADDKRRPVETRVQESREEGNDLDRLA